MIKLDENNFLVEEVAPWDGIPLSMRAVNIKEFVSADEHSGFVLLSMFESRNRDVQYTSTRIDSRDTHLAKALSQAGYQMTEIVIKVSGGLTTLPIDDRQFNKFVFEEASEDDHHTLSEHVVAHFDHGKFHEDPLIERRLADSRNVNMVGDLTRKFTTYVGRVNDDIIGFMILNRKDTLIELLLGGMHPAYRHLSYSFWNKLFFEYQKQGVKKVTTTISAANIPVINLYSRLGFKFSQALYGYRKFRKDIDVVGSPS